ncbi:MAG: hypothetical protein WAW52_14920 [Methanothrix sp.]
MALDIGKLIKYIIYLLAILLFILAAISLLIYVIVELKMSDARDFTAMGAISNAITAVVGLLIFIVTFLYLLATRAMVDEMKRQRAAIEEPAVSIKVVPSADAANILNLVLKNTGGGAAYDVTVKFNPDIPYKDNITLNQLNMFHNMALLDKGESVELFFASAPVYFKSDKPKKTKATVEYYITPPYQREINPKPKIRIIEINLEERKDQLQIRNRSMDDLVKEIEELKQGLLLIARDIEESKVKKND